jgi:hypothetical protein
MAKKSKKDYATISTVVAVKQTWCITSPELPGGMHRITSEIEGLPSDRGRFYAADMAKKVAKLADWGGGGGP